MTERIAFANRFIGSEATETLVRSLRASCPAAKETDLSTLSLNTIVIPADTEADAKVLVQVVLLSQRGEDTQAIARCAKRVLEEAVQRAASADAARK